jgi:hypothetical protein
VSTSSPAPAAIRQRAGVEEVVAVDVAVHVARGPREPLVDGVALPGVFLTHPPREPVGVALDDVHAVVGAAAVDDEVFQVRVALVED